MKRFVRVWGIMTWKKARHAVIAAAFSVAVLTYFGVVAASAVISIVKADTCAGSHQVGKL